MKRWVVGWKWPSFLYSRTEPGTLMWCWTRRNKAPDPDARSDIAYCGATVMFRVGSGKRARPTCPDCLAKLKRDTKKRAGGKRGRR